ncbi:MAG: hypothetical protein ACREIA_15630 [Opitutaceae bacterium]
MTDNLPAIDIESMMEKVMKRVRARRPHPDPEIEKPRLAGLAWSGTINFSRNGNGSHFILFGFDGPEDGFTWIVGAIAEVALPVAPYPMDLLLVCSVFPHTCSAVPLQTVTATVNDIPLAVWDVRDERTVRTILLSSQYSRGTSPVIRFEVSSPFAPSLHSSSKDDRRLGIAIRSLRLESLGTAFT